MIRSIESKTSPAAVTCVICQEEILFGKALCGDTPTGEHVEVLVCPRHVMPDWLRHTSPRLALDSARTVLHAIRWSIAEREGRKLTSERRPTVRTKIDPAPASDTGQEALASLVCPGKTVRLSLAGFCDRALGLLFEMLKRLITAGDASGCARGRRESEVRVTRT